MCKQFENKNIASVSDLGIENKTLREYTERLMDYAWDMRANALRVASLLSIIRDNAETLCAEYEGTTPTKKFEFYAEHVVGLKRAQANQYARVGKEFLDENGVCKIVEPNDSSYTVTQLQLLAPLGYERISKAAIEGEISPDMTANEIRAYVHDNDPKRKEKDAKKAKAEEAKAKREEAAKAAEEKIHGKKVAQIDIFVLAQGDVVIKVNDNELDKNDKLYKYLVRNLAK